MARLRWTRLLALPLLAGGCLIVRTEEDVLEDPCPPEASERIADAAGPFVLADAIYFIGDNGTLSRLPYRGGPVSELTANFVSASQLAADDTHLYWIGDDTILRRPLAGGPISLVGASYENLTALVVDDTSVVWASSAGLDRWSKADGTVTHLDDATVILGLGAWQGVYYYSYTSGGVVRRSPPTTDVVSAHFPGPLVVDGAGIYFFEAGEPFVEYDGTIWLVPHGGGPAVPTATNLPPVFSLAADATHLYFTTVSDARYRIKRVSRLGGTVRTLACGPFLHEQIHVAASADFVYYADSGALYRIAKAALPDD